MAKKRTRWVIYHGGPNDGQMMELPWSFSADDKLGVIVHGPDVHNEGGSFRMGPFQGVYRPSGMPVEDLDVVRLTWSHRQPKRRRLSQDERDLLSSELGRLGLRAEHKSAYETAGGRMLVAVTEGGLVLIMLDPEGGRAVVEFAPWGDWFAS
jgi:hypothetical protein